MWSWMRLDPAVIMMTTAATAMAGTVATKGMAVTGMDDATGTAGVIGMAAMTGTAGAAVFTGVRISA